MLKKIAVFIIDIYGKFLSPLKLKTCRYYPTCSSYMKEAIEKKGVLKGLLKGLLRLLRCNQFFPGGYDPVK